MFQFSGTITQVSEPVAQTTNDRRVSRIKGFNSHETALQQEIAYNQ
jgi:hypothetical protein